jgi:protein tyrosine phosphatase
MSLAPPRRPLESFCRLGREQQFQRIFSEFSQLQKLDHVPTEAIETMFATAVSAKHREKNRYVDVIANEATLYPDQATGRYINANVIPRELFDVPHTFVACQAPLPDHMAEFWQVVAESRTPLIINLTGLVEGGRVKSHAYWPVKVGATNTYGSSKVTLLSETSASESPVADTSLRTVRHEPSGHELTLAHFEGWPDMGVPANANGVRAIITFIESMRDDAPIFVHCSAGIGRTGTLISAYIARQMLKRQELGDDTIVNVVAALKSARCGMVQRKEQYGFVYQCVLEDMSDPGLERQSPPPPASPAPSSS